MLPIVCQEVLTADRPLRRRILEYADRLRGQELFVEDGAYRDLAVVKTESAPALILDDFTDVSLFTESSLFLEQRARLRAQSGDTVVTVTPPDVAYDDYLTRQLGLGDVRWLSPRAAGDSMRLAQTCWTDRRMRRELVRALRAGGLRYVHPHMGNRAIWRMARLLSLAAHRRLRVLAPPPALTRWVTDKVAFAKLVADFLDPAMTPQTTSAHGFAHLSQRVRALAQSHRYLGLKVPDSAGGFGNLVLEAAPLRQLPLSELHDHLRTLLPLDRWPANKPMLVGVWETNVLESGSLQTWIPPLAEGDPIFEGLFSQLLTGEEGCFVGCCPLELPPSISRPLLAATARLTLLFQQLGYVGRCSFDFLLVGDDLESARLEFIECNARWGGTSVPMTCVNRLFGDWRQQPFAAVAIDHVLPVACRFRDVMDWLGPDLLRRLPGSTTGWLLPFATGRIESLRGLNWIVLGRDIEQVKQRVRQDLPKRLALWRATSGSSHPARAESHI